MARSITAGTDVNSLAISGTGTEYSVSGITAYDAGIKYNDVFYAGNGDNVALTLSHADGQVGYTFSQYAVTGSGTLSAQNETSATLTMADADQTINAEWIENKTLGEAVDNSSWITENDGKVFNITLTCTLQTGGWNTFAVPFDAAIPNGWTVKELTGATVSGKTLTLTFSDATAITAGKPYLVKVDAAAAYPAFADVTIKKDKPGVSYDAVDFIPTFGLTNLTESKASILFIGASNRLYRPSAAGQQMKGFRAYFVLKGEAANAQSFTIDLSEATAIQSVPVSVPVGADGYNLGGQRVAGGYKGIVIVNGKKVIK